MRTLLLTAVLLSPVGLLAPAPTTISGTVAAFDRVEREVRVAGQRAPFVTAFSTVHQVRGRAVTVREFWAAVRVGMTADIRARSYGPFRVAERINVR